VLWDQRGTRYSQPRLNCQELRQPAYQAGPEAGPGEAFALQQAAWWACGQRLRREAGDLSDFNTLENAHDVDRLRRALGYETINFYGVSYGTELGQMLMRTHGDIVRSAVLDGVMTPDFSLLTDVAGVKQRIADEYFQACDEAPSCHAAYPDLAQRFLAMLDRLDRQPIELPGVGVDTRGGSGVPLRLTGTMLADLLYRAVYLHDVAPLMPYALTRLEAGDTAFARSLLHLLDTSRDNQADGLYVTVVCASHAEGAVPEAADVPGVHPRVLAPELATARLMLQVCSDWGIRPLPLALRQPVDADVPALLLSGRFDPVTPPGMAERVASHLTRAQSVVFPGGAHGQAFVSPCANGLIRQFLEAPGDRVDDRCARDEQRRFLLPRDLVHLPGLADIVAGGGMRAQLVFASPYIGLLLAGLVLFSAVPVYAVVEVLRTLTGRHHPPANTGPGASRLLAAAPWLPVLAALLLAAFVATFAAFAGIGLARNRWALLLGTVPGGVRWALLPALAFALAIVGAAVSAVLMWRHRDRTLAGRLYYAVLVVAGVLAVVAVARTGLLSWPA